MNTRPDPMQPNLQTLIETADRYEAEARRLFAKMISDVQEAREAMSKAIAELGEK